MNREEMFQEHAAAVCDTSGANASEGELDEEVGVSMVRNDTSTATPTQEKKKKRRGPTPQEKKITNMVYIACKCVDSKASCG